MSRYAVTSSPFENIYAGMPRAWASSLVCVCASARSHDFTLPWTLHFCVSLSNRSIIISNIQSVNDFSAALCCLRFISFFYINIRMF